MNNFYNQLTEDSEKNYKKMWEALKLILKTREKGYNKDAKKCGDEENYSEAFDYQKRSEEIYSVRYLMNEIEGNRQ